MMHLQIGMNTSLIKLFLATLLLCMLTACLCQDADKAATAELFQLLDSNPTDEEVESRINMLEAEDHQRFKRSNDKLKYGDGVICRSLRISTIFKRDSFALFRSCSVVEGNLFIVLTKRPPPTNEDGTPMIMFPKLKIVTGYVLIYRNTQITSLKHFLPELRLVLGNSIIMNYAFIVEDNMALTELGLKNLVKVTGGGVRIGRNPSLCGTELVNWDWISEGTGVPNVLKLNRDPQTCLSACPRNCTYCFSNQFCQKKFQCDDELNCTSGTCSTDEWGRPICCHSECLGGCTKGGSPHHCMACRHAMYNGSCVTQCPKIATGGLEDTFLLNRWYCTSEDFCKSLYWEGDIKYKLYYGNDTEENECRKHCPLGYKPRNETGQICVRTPDDYNHVCVVKRIINNKEILERFADRSCNTLYGNVNLQLDTSMVPRGVDPEEFFAAAFEHVHTITGTLQVRKSAGLKSLRFFRRLRMIEGRTLKVLYKTPDNKPPSLEIEEFFNFSKSYVVEIAENRMLTDLFNPGQKVKLGLYGNQSVAALYNRMLCPTKLEQFVVNGGLNYTKMRGVNISLTNNGDLTSCWVKETGYSLSVKAVVGTRPVFSFGFPDHNSTSSNVLWAYYRKLNSKEIAAFETILRNETLLSASRRSNFEDIIDPLEDEKLIEDEMITTVDQKNTSRAVLNNDESLQAYTYYALFAKFIDFKAESFSTNRLLFRTKPGIPDPVSELNVKAAWKTTTQKQSGVFTPTDDTNDSPVRYKLNASSQEASHTESVPAQSEMIVNMSWVVPFRMNGRLSHYDVYISPLETEEYIAKLDLCNNVFHPPEAEQPSEDSKELALNRYLSKDNDGDCHGECGCSQLADAREDYLTDLHTDWADVLQLNKSSLDTSLILEQFVHVRLNRGDVKLKSNTYQTHPMELKLPPDFQLVHFTDYRLMIRACVNSTEKFIDSGAAVQYPDEPIAPTHVSTTSWPDNQFGFIHKDNFKCGAFSEMVFRTPADVRADKVDSNSLSWKSSGNNTGSYFVSWSAPSDPNGVVVKYILEHRGPGHDVKKHCVTASQFEQSLLGHRSTRESEGNRPDGNKRGGILVEGLAPGEHKFRVATFSLQSLYGQPTYSGNSTFSVPAEETSEVVWWVIVVIALILIIAVILIAVIVIRRKRSKERSAMIEYTDPNLNYWADYEADEWEIKRDDVQLLEDLGKGSFGMVYSGLLSGVDSTPLCVAVKTLHTDSNVLDRRMFLAEASHMKQFQECAHIVKLLGIVSEGKPVLVVMELMEQGDLKTWLRKRRPDEDCSEPAPSTELISYMAAEIADGMLYLADKKYVHRDLAARNCMVAASGMVKIGDFGMTRDIYDTDYYRKGDKGLLPVRWMAPESLKDGTFTSMSDVWSFGVVLWEMVTLAAQPYQGMSNEEVLSFVTRRGTLRPPDNCPVNLSRIMLQCWQYFPKHRPSFADILGCLEDCVDDSFYQVAYVSSELRQQILQHRAEQEAARLHGESGSANGSQVSYAQDPKGTPVGSGSPLSKGSKSSSVASAVSRGRTSFVATDSPVSKGQRTPLLPGTPISRNNPPSTYDFAPLALEDGRSSSECLPENFEDPHEGSDHSSRCSGDVYTNGVNDSHSRPLTDTYVDPDHYYNGSSHVESAEYVNTTPLRVEDVNTTERDLTLVSHLR